MAVFRTSTGGIAYPGDVQALKRVYDELCSERGLSQGSPAAENLARATMDLFGQGVFDEDEIAETLRLYLDRKTSGPNFQPALAA
ncbi:MAG TPA: hypothetical protein VGV39_26725 [Mesorhizobium sp.]|jgi:hypothetical protein|uniref:hypothetical protein n=1 Tax=Mesorhizobium sp. TaxID=1871066 RepID=UPI002DDD890E|nr:hypothetical protein [Mesorhizobium sp.]HEV2506695.1 hypothetical protein [Mesorhizobium sp.]